MTLFKCKMCGGNLEVVEGVSVAECEYCGTMQPVPMVMDESLQNLFNRANSLRIKCEFDKAERLYENILQADSTLADAYWGLILCKYGIEYVDDPQTFKKIPTCHRASYASIIADEDYKAALHYADDTQRALYEQQAKEIDRIQRDILAIAQNEEPYDVFICYKETDANGKRTQDSVMANDIYYQLTQEGFKVFYAAISLEGKLGSAYEPIIFAALNSAKVMLVIGTKPEYYQAVWVKNEWSRYLKIIKNDHSKMLIPCYRDMDAYDLPDEFAHLQSQDMSRLGFVNDLIRGIKKILHKDQPRRDTPAARGSSAPQQSMGVAPLIKRIRIFLEDGDWATADEYCEKALDIDPENGEVYLCKLMAELHVRKQDELGEFPYPFDQRSNYQKAVRFATPALKEIIIGYIEQIQLGIYNNACEMMAEGTEESYHSAARLFQGIESFRDAEQKIKDCQDGAKFVHDDIIYNEAMAKIDIPKKKPLSYKIHAYNTAATIFSTISEHKDAEEKAQMCLQTVTALTKQRKRKDLLNAFLTLVGFAGGTAAFFALVYLISHWFGLV